jgi:hypothetical protein
MVKNMEWEFINILMEIFIKDNLSLILKMVMDYIKLIMGMLMKENLKKD